MALENSSPSAAEVAHVGTTKDVVYYFSLVTFKVDNCLFRVPKVMFEQESHFFRDMFAMHVGSEGEDRTTYDSDKPINLEGVQKETFKLLLAFLYPQDFANLPSLLTLKQYTSLIGLSKTWGFDKIRAFAIEMIRNELWDGIEAAEKVRIAQLYEITEWYADAYYELATRSEPLSLEEAYGLGLEFCIKMARVREKVVAARSGCFPVDVVARTAINEVFLGIFPSEPPPQPPDFVLAWEARALAGDQASEEAEARDREWAEAEAKAWAEAEAKTEVEAREEAEAQAEAEWRIRE